jgi:hypothetical protein
MTDTYLMFEWLGNVVEVNIEAPGLEYAARIHEGIRFG